MSASTPQNTWPRCSWVVKIVLWCTLLATATHDSRGCFFHRLTDLRELTWFIAQVGVWCFETELLELVHKEQEHFSGKCDRTIYFLPIYFLSQTSTFQQADYEIRLHLLLHCAVPWYRGRTIQGGSLLHEAPMTSSTIYKVAMKDQLFFNLSQKFTHLALGRSFYKSPVHQKYTSSKTWSNLASSPKPELFWVQAKQVAAQSSSLLGSGKTPVTAAGFVVDRVWESQTGCYSFSRVTVKGCGWWLQEQRSQLLCTHPLPTSPLQVGDVSQPASSPWAVG